MLHRRSSQALWIGIVGFTLVTPPAQTPADIYVETDYLATSSVVNLSPTSYVVPTVLSTSYLPTSYVPTSYSPTSSVMPLDPVVYPTTTTYVRRSVLRPRRYVERSYYSYPTTSTAYVPTSYVSSSYVPTSSVMSSSLRPTAYVTRSYIAPTSFLIDSDVVTTSATRSSSSYPCETTSSSPIKPPSIPPSNSTSGDSGVTMTSKPLSPGTTNERRPQGMVSTPSGDDGPSSAVNQTIPPVVQTPPAPKAAGTPTIPLPEPGPIDPGTGATAPGGTGASPAGDVKILPPGETGAGTKPNETMLRTVRRPTYDGRNILRGQVISAESRLPEEGVTVILSNVTKAFADKQAMTDADGGFKISLPDGDWVVKVKMPSGTVYPVGRDYLTASNGRITDPSGRAVPEFKIVR